MSVSLSITRSISKFSPIISVLTIRKHQLIILTSATVYAVIYMFAVGIISYYPGFAPLKVSTPIVRAESIGIMVITASYTFIFIFYSAIAFLIVSSFLVGVNISLIFYSRKISKACGITNMGSRGIFGILPAFFTTFSCCGGGLLVLVIGSTAFSSLSLSSKYMAPLTIAALAIGTILMSMKVSNSYRRRSYWCEVREGEKGEL